MDRAELEKCDLLLSANARLQLGRERFLAYLAFTRARHRLILTTASFDANGTPLNGSPFLLQIKRLFPQLQFETAAPLDWPQAEHSSELILPLLKGETEITSQGIKAQESDRLLKLPSVAAVLARLNNLPSMETEEWLSQGLAAKLYGPILRTSVSRLEQFAACPFKFFVHSGLRAEERKRFELDLKEQGSFQHDVLAAFHDRLQRENKRWREITPQQARDLIASVATDLAATYRDGLLLASDQSRFLLRAMTESLQDFIETLVGWMRGQYRFDPVAVEIAFGDDDQTSPWELDLGEGHRLALRGRIDRVDVCDIADERRVVVMDYKSSQRRLDPVLMANGLQLQLLVYLNVLRRWRAPLEQFGATRLTPAGVFYVSLRGKYEREMNRSAALNNTGQARQLAYRHTGRFDAGTLRWLDARPGVREGDQFNFRLTNTGRLHKNCREPLPTVQFEALLDSVEEDLKEMGQRIFAGIASVSPYRRGLTIACDQCDYRAICRIDPWTHRFRVLR